jgi:hypothetical protein
MPKGKKMTNIWVVNDEYVSVAGLGGIHLGYLSKGFDITKYQVEYLSSNEIHKKAEHFYEKIKNITKEMHNKISIYLCQNYKRIIIPEFKVSQMIDDKKRFVKRTIKELKEETSEEKKHVLLKKLKEVKKENRLSRKVKFVLLSQSHYKFKQHLINKCNEYGCELEIVT